jgi:two-component system, NarL family, nitrate/nitrite response regulator NarL
MLDNWKKAFPKALVTSSLKTIPLDEPVLFWLHANANNKAWLDETMAELAQKFKGFKVVVLANAPNQPDALAVMTRGCVGYCHAYSEASMLKELRTVVMHGGIWLGPDLLQTLIGATRKLVHNSSDNVAKALSLLTTREKQVALEAAEGSSNKEIARSLDITERTVKAHISAILEKLKIKDRLQLALVMNERVGELQQNVTMEQHSKVRPFKVRQQQANVMSSLISDDKKLQLLA